MKRSGLAVACLIVAALVVTACSDDGDGSSSPSKSTTTSTAPTNSTGTRAGTGTTTTTDVTSSYGPNVQPAVGIGVASPLGSKLFAAVVKIDPVQLKANGPGDTSGPGVLVSVEIRNDTERDVNLGGLVVNAHYGANVPAPPARTAAADVPLEGKLAPGRTKTGRYAFRVPSGQTGALVLDVQQTGAPNTVIVDTRI